MPAAKPKSKAPTRLDLRQTLAKEYLEFLRENAAVFGHQEGLKAELIAYATEDGASFTEILLGLGRVSVGGEKEAEDKGNLPELNVTGFLILSKARQAKLIEDGIVAMVPHTSRRSSGRVTTKLF